MHTSAGLAVIHSETIDSGKSVAAVASRKNTRTRTINIFSCNEMSLGTCRVVIVFFLNKTVFTVARDTLRDKWTDERIAEYFR